MPLSRRRLLIRAMTGTAVLAAGQTSHGARAQARRGLFGIDLPEEVQSLLPTGPLNVLESLETIIALEREAEVRRLPHSVLELLTSSSLPTDIEALYSAALPRLVALIDRATGRRADGGIGDRAAELLARLHFGEHQVPEALRPHLSASATRGGMLATSLRHLQLDEVPVEPILESVPVIQQIEEVPEVVVDALPEVALPDEPTDATLPPLSRSIRYDQLAEEYRSYFNALTVRQERQDTAQWCLSMLRQSRRRYEAVSARTGVPWYFVGATHGLEASFNFRGHLHNGDFPLSQRTRQVPSNRPQVWLPPSDWESSAVDALRMMGFAGQSDWSLARTLHRLEAYNGFGYRRRGAVTPYLWSFSQHYDRGKFVADGRRSATARSQQCGAAVMLKLLADAGDVEFA